MRANELAILAKAYADAPPEPVERDPYGDPVYIVPSRWTPAHVLHRMAEAYRVIHYTVTRPGPRGMHAAWPSMLREWADLVDESLRERIAGDHERRIRKGERPSPIDWRRQVDGPTIRMLENQSEANLRRSAERPTSSQIQMADEAISWPIEYLAEDPQLSDAVTLWAYCVARGVEMESTLKTRKRLADAVIDDRHNTREAKKELDRAEVRRRSLEWARAEIAAGKPYCDVSTAAVQRARAEIAERDLSPALRPRRQDVFPDKVFSRTTLDRLRLLGADLLAERLDRDGVSVL